MTLSWLITTAIPPHTQGRDGRDLWKALMKSDHLPHTASKQFIVWQVEARA